MAEGGNAIGKLWRKLGKGYYALMAVGTFLYLDAMSLIGSVRDSDTVQAFVAGEAMTFLLETLVNTLFATFWPVVWVRNMGWPGLGWAFGGYFVWILLLAIVLSRREDRMRREIGL